MAKEAIPFDMYATGVVDLQAAASTKVGGGRYSLRRILGRGGMGIVWLAHDERLQTEVALKFLPPHIRFDPTALDDLRRETARSQRLTHPNILRIHDLYESEHEDSFISMEYVDGPHLGTLRVQQPDRVLTWSYLEPLIYQLCDALEYAHGEGIIHRDLKPANLMVDRAGRLKLADFGIARAVTDTMSRVSITQTSGTLLYMSPQQLDGAQPKPSDDIYGIGTTLYELLTSKPPFYTGDLLQQARNSMPVSMRDRLREFKITNDIPAHVDEAVLACLSKIESRRPQPPRELARWLSTGQPPERFQTSPKPKFAAVLDVAMDVVRRLVARKPVWIGTAVGLAAITLIFGIAHRKPDKAAARPHVEPVTPARTAPAAARPEPASLQPAARPKPSVQVSKIVNPPQPAPVERKTNVQVAAATPAPAPVSPPKPVVTPPEAPTTPVAAPAETPAPAPPRPAPVAVPAPAPKPATPAPAPVVKRQPTALELARTGNNHVSERSKNKIVEIVSDHMAVDAVTQQWRIVYYDPKATYKTVEVRFEGGEMVRVHEPTRLLKVFSTTKPLEFEKLKVESDQALRIALALPSVKDLAVRSVELELERGYAGAPVWNVRLFGNATPESTTETAFGYAVIFADDGRVLKETFAKKATPRSK